MNLALNNWVAWCKKKQQPVVYKKKKFTQKLICMIKDEFKFIDISRLLRGLFFDIISESTDTKFCF